MNRLFRSLSATVKRPRQSTVLRYLGLCLFNAVLASSPAWGAERVYITYGPLEVSLPVESLELFTKQGIIDRNIDGFAQYATEEQLARLRVALQARADVSPVTISQFLYTPQGEVLLERLGRVIQTKARQPGFYAIRAALILAAADPEGLTILNVLRKFPTYGIRINIGRGLEIADQLTRLINQSNRAIAGVVQLANQEVAAAPTLNLTDLPDPQRQGSFRWQKLSLTLTNDNRGRTFPVDLYLPQGEAGKPAPVIVISHGLGSDRISFDYLAEYLASYGFAVAVPEHPGSNAQQLQNLVAGRANEVAQPAEFIDRVLDIKDILDYLGTLSQSDPRYRGRLDMQRVGAIGQSFGGYTVLALAGAPINFEELDRECQLVNDTWNISLLLQCSARNLPRIGYQLKDDRIKAAIAVNPITSSIFGKASLSQIKIPLMIVGGSADTVAPAVLEQIQPFTWLTTANKYLAIMKNGTHFSTIKQSPQSVFQAPPEVIGPEPDLARRYLKEMSLAFMETYILNRPEFRTFLQPAYAKAISRDSFGLSILRSLTPEQLQKILSNTPSPAPLSPTPQPTPSPR